VINSGGSSRVPVDLGKASGVGSVLLVLVFLVKVYAVARYSLTTMTGLVAATPLQVVLGTISFYAYLVMPALALGTAWLGVGWLRAPDRASVAPATWPVLAGIVALTMLMSPLVFLWTGVALLAACLRLELGIRRLLRDAPAVTPDRRYLWWWLLLVVAVASAWQFPDLRVPGLVLVASSLVLELPLSDRVWVFLRRRRRLRRFLGRTRGFLGLPGPSAAAVRAAVPRLARQARGRTFLHLGTVALTWYLVSTVATPWAPAQIFVLKAPVEISTQDKSVAPRALNVEHVWAPIGYLLTQNDGTMTVLEADTRRIVHFPADGVRAMPICHQDNDQLPGKRPLLSYLTGTAYNSPNITCETLREQLVPTRGIAFNHAGTVLAGAGWNGAIGLWNPATGDSVGAAVPPRHTSRRAEAPPESGQVAYPLAFNATGTVLAEANPDGTVTLLRTGAYQIGSTLPARLTPTGSPAPVVALAFSPDGHTLVTAAADTVTLWNPSAGQATSHLTPDPGAPVNALAFAGQDGKTLVTGDDNDKIQLWDIPDPAHPARLGSALKGHENQEIDGSHRTNVIYAIAISPDGRTVAVGGGRRDIVRKRFSEKYQADATVQLWDITHRATPVKLGHPLRGHTGAVNAVTFSPDGRTLATASSDATVRRWQVTDPARPTELGHPLKGHTGAVNAVTFSPDGKTLATTGSDQTIRLWDCPRGQTWDVLTPP
jgi:WD40 repeat protein